MQIRIGTALERHHYFVILINPLGLHPDNALCRPAGRLVPGRHLGLRLQRVAREYRVRGLDLIPAKVRHHLCAHGAYAH